MEDLRIVTKQSHPILFEALEIISHDRGAGAGHSNYAIPAPFNSSCDDVEMALVTLTTADLEDFSIGEESDMQAIASRSPELQAASKFLNAFFNDFEDE